MCIRDRGGYEDGVAGLAQFVGVVGEEFVNDLLDLRAGDGVGKEEGHGGGVVMGGDGGGLGEAAEVAHEEADGVGLVGGERLVFCVGLEIEADDFGEGVAVGPDFFGAGTGGGEKDEGCDEQQGRGGFHDGNLRRGGGEARIAEG